MGDITYDDDAAARLQRVAGQAADCLTGQSAARRAAAESARDDFEGAYAKRFEESARVEADDRPKLASSLRDLANQVGQATAAAKRERSRRVELEAWRGRQEAREREAASSPFGVFGIPAASGLDLEPSETPVSPPHIAASFSARGRTRSGSGTSDGRSAADPDALRQFATTSRGLDAAAGSERTALKNAWSGFTARCSWAPIDSASLLGGFDRLLQENSDDAAWLERIADAFDRAGGHGSLSNATLDIAAAADLPPGLAKVFTKGLSPAEVAALWAKLRLSKADRNDLRALPVPILSQLGNLEGVDYWARDTANRVVLDARIHQAQLRLRELERSTTYDPGGATYATAFKNLTALQEVRTASNDRSNEGRRFLISLDDSVVPPLAAISIGDLDTAENVTWAVPGMATDTLGMNGWTDAAQNLYKQQSLTGPADHAVVSWVGYTTPPQPVIQGQLDFGVLGTTHAKDGSRKLAAALRGLDAARGGDSFTNNVVAHSYGSTTAAYALTKRDVHVDTFTTIGSAGIPNSIPDAGTLHAGHVYAGQAQNIWVIEPGRGDRWAQTGRLSPTHSQDPTDPAFGATAFGTDGVTGDDTKHSVDDHNVLTDDHRGYLDADTESLYNIGQATTGHPEAMTKYEPKGMTWYEKTVLEQMQGVP
ncbi:alpha/beta hydrolase [Curtobacterium sp. VKM Ac-2922]|uniref:alpha/beta hydrolase n=1 Tax=Curtobacterium sp. VKM Ac-2922 TaxID=2929475 RepID=UPI001FB2BBEE|nr:alpha/beta hydrolase [Curtobacterium sp. VKM Ac-2922]MCJ1712935.1 alpha/beta hydrolase family protein [Curtobacterium sp. VKM Ac-2922]